MRNLALRIIPADILDECKDMCKQVKLAEYASDPAGAKKRLYDSFDSLNISPVMLKEYLGHDNPSPVELDKLRGIFTAIRDGQTNWREVMESVEDKTKTNPFSPKTKEKTAIEKAEAAAAEKPETIDAK
jgi:hypothetical protein